MQGDYKSGGQLCVDTYGSLEKAGKGNNEKQQDDLQDNKNHNGDETEEVNAGNVVEINTKNRMARMDGRFIHWVKGHEGNPNKPNNPDNPESYI